MTVPGNIDALLLGGLGGYQIERSLRFNSPDSAYLNRTPASAGNRRTWTWSGWVKQAKPYSNGGNQFAMLFGSSSDASNRAGVQFNSDTFQVFSLSGGSTQLSVASTAVLRDPSAWYHFVVSIDSTQAASSDRAKLYINGSLVTALSSTTYPTQNTDLYLNSTNLHGVGGGISSSSYFDGYLTEINFIDGQALTPSSFGETNLVTGVWGPKRYAGTYGTNGFYLKFADNSNTTAATLGKDSSGNGNNWTPNNFSVTAGVGNDSMIDVPTPYADGGNGRGNYCTGNPLYIPSTFSQISLTNGNLEWGQAATNVNCSMAGTFTMRSGKWYWEVTVDRASNYSSIGMQTDVNTAWRGGGTVLYRSDGQKSIGGTASAYGASYTTNDVLGFAYDADAGTLTCYKNNTSQGTIYSSGTGNTWVPAIHDDNAGAGVTYYHKCNFGQRAFTYTPPTGFLALNTQNLPEPSIKKPSSYFDTKLYTGTAATLNITGLGFSPDLVWTKNRSSINNHRLYDALRGTTKELYSNTTDAETTDANSLTAFNSDGFTLGSSNGPNNSGSSYVAWCWDESATPGFDIVTYTGNGSNRTIAHSLGVAPSMMVIKRRDAASFNWVVWHSATGNVNPLPYLNLNGTAAVTNGDTSVMPGTVTSTTFPAGAWNGINASGGTYVAYLWSEVAGFSKFGSYTGNGSADGPFVHCGFRPRWVMWKKSSAAESWVIIDTARDQVNLAYQKLYANASGAEDAGNTYGIIDVTANGFKIRSTHTVQNNNGDTYIFAAFAESPFKYSLAR